MAGTRARVLETVGWLLTAAIPLTVLAMARLGGPSLLENALIGADFVIAAPLVFVTLRRQWRTTKIKLSALRRLRDGR